MNAEKIKELRGLIAQWRATNCRTEAQDRVYRVCADQLEPLLAALLDELEALTADAERYRWLRDNCKREWESDMENDKGAPSLDIDFNAPGHDLDAAIDAARHEPKDAER
jgi:hypothetical protein